MNSDDIKEKILIAVIAIYIIVFFLFCLLGLTDCAINIFTKSKTNSEIKSLKSRICELEESYQLLREDVNLQKQVFSAYVNGELVE